MALLMGDCALAFIFWLKELAGDSYKGQPEKLQACTATVIGVMDSVALTLK